VNQEDLLVDGIPGAGRGDVLAIGNSVGIDQVVGQQDPAGLQGVHRSEVVPGSVLPVSNELDPIGHTFERLPGGNRAQNSFRVQVAGR
jgi:hypothetical protein